MEKLRERTFYYGFALAKVMNEDIITIAHKIALLFSCEEHIDDQWDKLIGDETLKKLSTSRMVEYWQNYIHGFCKDSETFGKRGIENGIMELKKKALILVESENVYEQSEHERKDRFLGESSVLYALLLYINKKPREAYLSVIRKAAEHNIDAIVILMALDSTQRERLLQKLKKDGLSVSNSTYEYLENRFASATQRKAGGN